MARRKTVYVKWDSGGLEVRLSRGLITVVAANAALYFEPRSVLVEADYEEPVAISDEKRLYVYIGFRGKLEPLEAPRIDVVGRYVDELGELRLVDLEFNRYLTILTPGDFLYDFAVITPDKLFFQTNARRKVYFEKPAAFRIVAHLV